MNMKPALFLHIQKTAGTSVVKMCREYYGETLVSHIDYRGRKPESFEETGFVSGHFGYGFARPLMGSRYSFTFLRDPVERVLSFYYFCCRSDPDAYEIYRLTQENTINDFLDMGLDNPRVKTHIWNHQTWQLACGWGNPSQKSILDYDGEAMLGEARTHLAEFDYVGFTESFDQDIHVILNSLGISRSAKALKTNAGGPRPRKTDLSSSIRERLARLTELDQTLYDSALAGRLKRV